MKDTVILGLLAAASVASTAAVRGRDGPDRPTRITKPYAARMADSWIRNNRETESNGWYGRAALYTGYEAVISRTGNVTLRDWYRSRIDGPIVRPDGSIPYWQPTRYSLDDYRIGHNVLDWYDRTGEDKYRTAAATIRAMYERHPRTPTGGFWHRAVVYPNQMWLDGIFMGDTFYARYTKTFQPANRTAWDDIVLQYDKIDAVTRLHATNLLVHGFDESKKAVWANPITGAAPIVWSRAVGWYFWSLVEVLDLLPRSHDAWDRVLSYYVTLAEGLKRAQDETSGGWWEVMSAPYPGRKGNYFESSAAAMFTYGWLAGLKRGYISEADYLAPATKAYAHLVNDFVTENADGTLTFGGTVDGCGLGSNVSFEYYTSVRVVQQDTRGVGPFLLAAVEWEERNGIQS